VACVAALEGNTSGAFDPPGLTFAEPAAKGECRGSCKSRSEREPDDDCKYYFHSSLSKGCGALYFGRLAPEHEGYGEVRVKVR
jgi:hypothetical protein